ncbi:MAG: hypothetical protein U0T36_06580 [Saprospiraceae bacterium]
MRYDTTMPQVFWKIDNKSGSDYDLSIYHGDQSGHLLIYSGKEILQIDFEIKSEKLYSFMLGDQLYQLHIKYRNGKPHYNLSNTSKKEKVTEWSQENFPTKHKIQALLFALVVIIFVVMFIIIFKVGTTK